MFVTNYMVFSIVPPNHFCFSESQCDRNKIYKFQWPKLFYSLSFTQKHLLSFREIISFKILYWPMTTLVYSMNYEPLLIGKYSSEQGIKINLFKIHLIQDRSRSVLNPFCNFLFYF